MRIAIANSKGGVGKSTMTVVLADYLAVKHHKRVLVIDLDPQATTSCLLKSVDGVAQARHAGQTLADYLSGVRGGANPNLANFRQHNATNLSELQPRPQAGAQGRIDLIASVPSLWFEENHFIEHYYAAGQQPADELYQHLSAGLAPIMAQYNCVLIDCPPNYSALTRAGLRLSEAVISPTTADEIAQLSLRDFTTYGVQTVDNGRLTNRHFVTVNRFGKAREERAVLDAIRQSASFLEPPISNSAVFARAIWNNGVSSRTTYDRKYGGFLRSARSDILKLGESVLSRIINA